MADYMKNYTKAIKKPLPELKRTFDAELNFLKRNSNKSSMVLDVGCGAGRPANDFARFVKRIMGIDHDNKMIHIAKIRCRNIKSTTFLKDNALNMDFPENSFDLSYATYNLIGSLKKPQRQRLVNKMMRVTKRGGKIINITWKQDYSTTKFLKEYYSSIGIRIIKADKTKTVTSKGTFDRISKKELLQYYRKAKLKRIKFFEIGPVWLAIIGTKS